MAENLVREEYAVNYQKNEEVLEDSKPEERGNQVSEHQSVFWCG